jgi:ABC-type transporter Mla subunit MlaD
MPTADSHPSPITKPVAVGNGPKPAGDRVFVSPRVVDEQAFREFSGELRSLLDEIRGAQSELASAGAQAAATAKDLSGSQDKYRQHLELTTKLLKALTSKSSDVEALVATIDERLERAQGVEASVERALEAKIGAFERTLQQRLDAVEERYEQRLAALEAGFEEKRTALEGVWAEQEARVREQIDSQRVFVQTGLSAQADEIETMLRDRASGLADDLASGLTGERERAETALAELVRQREEFSSETGEPLQNTLEQLRTACSIASKLVGWDPADPGADPNAPAEGSLGDLVRQAGKTREDAEWSVRRLGSIRDQAQSMISDLGESLDGSIALFDQLHAQRGKLDGEIVAILDRADATGAELQHRQSEIEALVSPLEDSLKKAAAVTRDLCSVADGAADLLTHAGMVRTDLEALLGSATELTEALAPWRAVILEASESATMPPAIAAVVDRFEREIGRDLAKMASAMQMIAQRAETTMRPPSAPGEMPEIVIRPRSEAADAVEADQR